MHYLKLGMQKVVFVDAPDPDRDELGAGKVNFLGELRMSEVEPAN